MFDRFAICEAAHLFASHYHSGQNSSIYKIFSRLHKIGFKPSCWLTLETAAPEVKEAYGRLVKKHFPTRCGWYKRL